MSDAPQSATTDDGSPRDTLPLETTVARALERRPVGSPCTNVCRLDVETRTHCTGCQRSRVEIKAWKMLDDAAKTAILEQLLARQREARR